MLTTLVALALQNAGAPVPPPADLSAMCPLIPAMTEVQIQVAEPLRSKKARSGDRFRIALAADLTIDGKVVLPAGIPGIGEVIEAKHPKVGKQDPGELILAARYLDLGAKRLPLRSFHLFAVGATLGGYTPYGVMEGGANVEIPAGTVASAKVAGACVDATPDPIPAPPTK